MKCPRCNTENEPTAQYCVNCAYPFQAAPQKAQSVSAGTYLLLMTIRFLIAIFGLWIIEKVVVGLPFVEKMVIRNFPLTVTNIINIVIALLMVILLISFAILLGGMWPRAFPKYQQAGTVLSGIIYLIVLSVLYSPIETLLQKILTGQDAATAVLILQVVFAVTALVLVIWLAIIVYNALPSWLNSIRQAMIVQPPDTFEISEKK
jgi:hypothetical protein